MSALWWRVADVCDWVGRLRRLLYELVDNAASLCM